jgi:hypothetical protein
MENPDMTKSSQAFKGLMVIGVDPGPWTGICGLRYGADKRICAAPVLAEVVANGAVVMIGALVAQGRLAGVPVVIGYEAFVVGRRTSRSGAATAGLVTRNLCGQLETLGTEHVAVVSHSAAAITAWCNAERIHAAGLYQLIQKREHARPAAHQAVYTSHRWGGIPDPLSKKAKVHV